MRPVLPRMISCHVCPAPSSSFRHRAPSTRACARERLSISVLLLLSLSRHEVAIFATSVVEVAIFATSCPSEPSEVAIFATSCPCSAPEVAIFATSCPCSAPEVAIFATSCPCSAPEVAIFATSCPISSSASPLRWLSRSTNPACSSCRTARLVVCLDQPNRSPIALPVGLSPRMFESSTASAKRRALPPMSASTIFASAPARSIRPHPISCGAQCARVCAPRRRCARSGSRSARRRPSLDSPEARRRAIWRRPATRR